MGGSLVVAAESATTIFADKMRAAGVPLLLCPRSRGTRRLSQFPFFLQEVSHGKAKASAAHKGHCCW